MDDSIRDPQTSEHSYASVWGEKGQGDSSRTQSFLLFTENLTIGWMFGYLHHRMEARIISPWGGCWDMLSSEPCNGTPREQYLCDIISHSPGYCRIDF